MTDAVIPVTGEVKFNIHIGDELTQDVPPEFYALPNGSLRVISAVDP